MFSIENWFVPFYVFNTPPVSERLLGMRMSLLGPLVNQGFSVAASFSPAIFPGAQ